MTHGDEPHAKRPLALVHYMPWFTAAPDERRWGWHWTMNHFDPETEVDGKREIAAHYYPQIGPYDSGDPDVIEYHLLLMKIAGIDGVIVDWYGLTDFRDYAMLHRNTSRLVEQANRLGMKFAICYEDQTIPALVKAGRLTDAKRIEHAVKEIRWMQEGWFRSEQYVSLAGKPLLLSFGHAGLPSDDWKSCLEQLSDSVAYVSQDFRREGATGAFDWPNPQKGVVRAKEFYEEAKQWAAFIPVAYPRFHDVYEQAGLHKSYGRIRDENGTVFRTTIQMAFASNADVIQIATWNDWGEGTVIEPSHEYGMRDLEVVREMRVERDPHFPFTREDLELPGHILKLRQSGKNRALVDRVVTAVCDRDSESAREELSRLINETAD